MNINKSYNSWNFRRGILELDIILLFFLKNKYDFLNKKNKLIFNILLKYDDMELYNLIILKKKSSNPKINNVLKIIKDYNYKLDFKYDEL